MTRSYGTAANVVLSSFGIRFTSLQPVGISRCAVQLVMKLASLELKHLLCSRIAKLYEDPLPATPVTPRCARKASNGCTEAVVPRSPDFFEREQRAAYTTPENTGYSYWTFASSTSATHHEGSDTMDTLQRYGSCRGAAVRAVRSCFVS
jgi:hypothetical protein